MNSPVSFGKPTAKEGWIDAHRHNPWQFHAIEPGQIPAALGKQMKAY